jgi:hypothetical protein
MPSHLQRLQRIAGIPRASAAIELAAGAGAGWWWWREAQMSGAKSLLVEQEHEIAVFEDTGVGYRVHHGCDAGAVLTPSMADKRPATKSTSVTRR